MLALTDYLKDTQKVKCEFIKLKHGVLSWTQRIFRTSHYEVN